MHSNRPVCTDSNLCVRDGRAAKPGAFCDCYLTLSLEQFLNLRCFQILSGRQLHTSVNVSRRFFAVEFRHQRFDAFITHRVGILKDQRINHAAFEIINQIRAGIEPDDDDFTGQAFLLDGLRDPNCRRFIRCKETIEIRRRSQNISRPVERFGAIRFTILKADNLNARILLPDRLLKSAFALFSRASYAR